MKKNIYFIGLVSLFTMFICEGVQAEGLASNKKEDAIAVQLLGINDFHGAIDNASYLASNLDQAEQFFLEQHSTGTSLRVQSGDMVGSSPINSSLLQDEPTIKVMNRMGIQYGTLGNHEFDEGLEEFNRILLGQQPKEGQFNPIVSQYPKEAATQQFLIANVIRKSDQQIPNGWKPYAICELDNGISKSKIGVIGVVTSKIPSLVSKKYSTDYDFLDEAETINYYASILKAQGIHAIVVLAHSGDANGIVNRLNQLNPEHSVDIFFDGHSHKTVNLKNGETQIVQSASSATKYSNVIGEISPDTNDFTSITATVNPIDKTIGKNSEIEKIALDATNRVKTISDEVIGYSLQKQTITRKENQYKESALGNFVADSQLVMARNEGFQAQASIVNNGSIRSDLQVESDGSIKYGSSYAVQPFQNPLYVVRMSKLQLEELLNKQYADGKNNTLQISGINYNYVKQNEPSQPYKVISIFNHKQTRPYNNDDWINVVMNEYIYSSDFWNPSFSSATLVGTMNHTDTSALSQYIRDHSAKLNPLVNGRKQYIEPQTASQYYLENLGKVFLKKNDRLFKDIDYKTKVADIAKNTVVKISHVEFTVNGIPRFVTDKGYYLTANKSIVQALEVKVVSQYYLENPGKVFLKKNDRLFKDIDFKTKAADITKNTVVTINRVEFTVNGIPRFVTDKGYYLTANKSIVQAN